MTAVCAILAVSLCPAAFAAGPETLVLENGALRAEVVPAWGGRLMFFGRPGGGNALWTNPSAATNTVNAKGAREWKNVGGEKTWVGAINSRYWKGFSTDGAGWPPPEWFDAEPLEIARANATNILLRSGEHEAADWKVVLEREFTLAGDRLLIDMRLENRGEAGDGMPLPDDLRRVWSVTQIPLVPEAAIRLCGERRAPTERNGRKFFPDPKGEKDGWLVLDMAAAPKATKIDCDGDALAATIPGAGRLVIEQTAPEKNLGAFKAPGRAIVFTSGTSSPDPYVELEFMALGPDAKQTLEFRIEDAAADESAVPDRYARMREDKLGMFIHWGLYAIPAKGEWMMYSQKIPAAEYDKLADEFAPPASFSPREWVRLAKRAGCRYAVLTTRHHDGFCLFDTKTTDFNSVKTAAKRDFVREFADACREEGLRVGFYYSIMNWQFDHSPNGVFDQKVWDGQVRVTHEALRELMTNYGKVDYLWYDGCSAPGITDADAMEKMWRIGELNAMVRSLQPGILVNDRSSVPADYSTPEQCLAPPPRGRMWESCITCNGSWGYTKDDDRWKSAETLVRSLLHCARFGGNLLVNIGPRADGSVPEECVKAFEGLGDYVARRPEAIYGAERDDWTEATHEAGVVTKANGAYWLHTLSRVPEGETPALDNAEKIERAADGIYRVQFKKGAKPCNWLGGRHDVDVRAGEAPVLGDNSGKEEPPCGAVVNFARIEKSAALSFPAGGMWKVEIGCVNAEGFKDTLAIDYEAEAGETKEFPLPEGAKGVYATRLTPAWKSVAPKTWEVAGVFPSRFYETRYSTKAVDEVFARDLLAEAAKAKFVPVGAANDKADKPEVRVNFNYSAPEKRIGYAFARRNFRSDRERTVLAAFGADWWGEVFVNGEKALVVRAGWKPTRFPLKLKKGDNEILVAVHGGSRQHWFTFYVNTEDYEGRCAAPGVRPRDPAAVRDVESL